MPELPFARAIYSEQLEQLIEMNKESNNVAILWDIENINPGVNELFIEGFLEYVSQFGRLTIARAFADWSNDSVKKMGDFLATRHFELIHVPKAKKNSADIELITHGMEIALKNPNINNFILVTGDADFRPLINSLRRSGKYIHVVYDANKSSEDLLILADTFIDYRELRPGGEEITNEELLENISEHSSTIQITKDEIEQIEVPTKEELDQQLKNAFSLLAEAAKLMIEGKKKAKIGQLKVRLLMLNPSFDLKKLGFKNWTSFVESAASHDYIKLNTKKGETLVEPNVEKIKESPVITKAFNVLIKYLKELDGKKGKQFHHYSVVAGNLKAKKGFPELKKIGFLKFKEFIQAAEVRKLIETKAEGVSLYLKRT